MAGNEDAPKLADYKFVIADDHPLFRGALRQALSGTGDALRSSKPATLMQPKRTADNDDLDLVLLDLTMPGASGLSGIVALRAAAAVPVVVVSANDDPVTIRRALDLGASGFISKSARIEDIKAAVRGRALAGDIAAPKEIDLGSEIDAGDRRSHPAHPDT